MKAWKPLALVTGYIFLIVTVSAQGLGGAEMTVGESLTTFVTEILGFPVDDVSEVLLFVVGPIFAFYFFLTNMMTMAFENFEDRIGRDRWDKKEELPTNLKLFSLVTAFITVVTIGRIAPGLILIFGALAVTLGILMMGGLLTRDGDGGGGNGGGDGGNRDDGDGGGNGQNNNNGATRGDYIERIADAGETITSGVRDNLDNRYNNQLEESLRYFDEDMISEIKRVQSKRSEIETHISQAENEISDPSNFDPSGDPKDYNPRTFQKIVQKMQMIEKLLDGMGDKIKDDFSGGPNPNYTGSELAKYVNKEGGIARNHGRNPMEEIASLNGKLDRILDSNQSSPPDDVFNEIIEELEYIIATGHFMNNCPIDLSTLASDREEAEKVIMKAASMKRIRDVSGRDETRELQNLAGWMDARRNVVNKLIERSEKLSRKELKLTKTEVEHIKKSIGEDKKIHNKLKDIKESLNRYNNIKNLREDVSRAENTMTEIDNKLASLESHANSHGKFESRIYEKLRKVESQI